MTIPLWAREAAEGAYAYTHSNPDVAELTRELCSKVGFRGICDLDWRRDSLAREYKLVDFNPRMGNQFRLFQTAAGIDVLRALYLDMTGQHVPPGDQVNGRRIVVEHIDLLARIGERGSGYAPSSAPDRAGAFNWTMCSEPSMRRA